MLEQLIIRKATSNDLPELKRIEQAIIAAERAFDPTLKAGTIHYYPLENMLDDPEVEVVVGAYRGDIIATGYARIENAKPFLNHEQYAYLGFMYVHPDYRGRGVIQKVTDALRQWAKEKGLHELRLEVYYKNEAAIKAYEKTDFKKHMIEMRMGI